MRSAGGHTASPRRGGSAGVLPFFVPGQGRITTMSDSTPYLQRSDFPEVGDRRYFDIKHNPKSVSKPVVIELREYSTDRKSPSFSRLLGIEYSIADKTQLIEAADRLLVRVCRIDDVVGIY